MVSDLSTNLERSSDRVGPSLVTVACLVAVWGVLLPRWFHYQQDDVWEFSLAHSEGLSWKFVTVNGFEHFGPLTRIDHWAEWAISPFNIGLGTATAIGLVALLLLSVTWLIDELEVPPRRRIPLLVVGGLAMPLFSVAAWNDQAVYIVPDPGGDVRGDGITCSRAPDRSTPVSRSCVRIHAYRSRATRARRGRCRAHGLDGCLCTEQRGGLERQKASTLGGTLAPFGALCYRCRRRRHLEALLRLARSTTDEPEYRREGRHGCVRSVSCCRRSLARMHRSTVPCSVVAAVGRARRHRLLRSARSANPRPRGFLLPCFPPVLRRTVVWPAPLRRGKGHSQSSAISGLRRIPAPHRPGTSRLTSCGGPSRSDDPPSTWIASS